jgi:hypothetical protein
MICTMTGPSVRTSPLSERRHLALGIDLQIVVAVFELLGAQIDLDQIVGQAGFQQRDVGRERAGSGRVIQFHRTFSFLRIDWLFGAAMH